MADGTNAAFPIIDIKKEDSQLIYYGGFTHVKQEEFLIPDEVQSIDIKEEERQQFFYGSVIASTKKQKVSITKKTTEKLDYVSIKDDPIRWAAQQAKEREKYKKKLKNGQRKLVANMSKREWESKKTNWKVSSKKYREKKKTLSENLLLPRNLALPITTPDLPSKSSSPQNSRAARGRSRIQRDHSTLFRENQKLKKQLSSEKKKAATYKKRMQQLTTDLKTQADL